MKSCRDIISDAEIKRIHGNANFGDEPKRRTVDMGVFRYAFGYSTGYTQLCILLEHGLIRKPKPGKYGSTLTKKGFQYLRAMRGDAPLSQILDLFQAVEAKEPTKK